MACIPEQAPFTVPVPMICALHPPGPQINVKSQIVKVTDTIEVAASGGAASEVLLCWPRRLAERISRIRVRQGARPPHRCLRVCRVTDMEGIGGASSPLAGTGGDCCFTGSPGAGPTT